MAEGFFALNNAYEYNGENFTIIKDGRSFKLLHDGFIYHKDKVVSNSFIET